VPWLSPKDMVSETLSGTQDHITEQAVLQSSVRKVSAGSVAIVVRSGILERRVPVSVVPFETTLNQDMKALVPRADVDIRWLAWGLRHMERELLDDCRKSGTTVASLDTKKLQDVRLPIPGIEEQRRIVDLLEDHLSRLDVAQSSLMDNRSRLQRLRLAASSQQLFTDASWPRVKLADLLEVSIGGVWGSAPGEDEHDVRVLRVTEMRRDGALDPSTAVLRSIGGRQLASRKLEPGDLLLEKSGGGPSTPVGRVGLVPELPTASVCSNFMQLLRPRRERTDPRFLHLYLQTFYLRGGTEPMQKASTNIRNLKASEYVRIAVPVPDLPTQARVVESVDSLIDQSQRLDSALEAASQRGNVLRRALLNAAFSGRLTGRSTDTEIVEQIAAHQAAEVLTPVG
jgi:type I restriction enzyme, S subunit